MNKHYAFWYGLLAAIVLVAGIAPTVLSGRTSTAVLVTAVVLSILVPPVLMWIAQRIGYPIGRSVSCPNCGTEMPLFRQPASIMQGLRGGYICPKCGTPMDAAGRPLS